MNKSYYSRLNELLFHIKEHIYEIIYDPTSNHQYPYHSLKPRSGQGRYVNAQCMSWFYDKVNHVLESTLYLIAFLP